MKSMTRSIWTYKGVTVYPASLNSSGIRWYARCLLDSAAQLNAYNLRADTKQGMRQLIRAEFGQH